jgi:hypothetical protein
MEQSTDLSAAQRSTAPLDFLLRTIMPRLIIAHGKPAIAHIGAYQTTLRVITDDHFSRGWSQSRARDLGRRIADDFTNG